MYIQPVTDQGQGQLIDSMNYSGWDFETISQGRLPMSDSLLQCHEGSAFVSVMRTDDGGAHKLVHNDAKKHKPCGYCVMNKIKTKSGWYAYTTYKCDVCEVPLCRGKRDCFNLYHAQLKQISIPETNDLL